MLEYIQQFSDWATDNGGFMTKVHCLGNNSIWITIQTVLSIVIVLAYAEFAREVYKKKKKTKFKNHNQGFYYLANVFLFCALSGYAWDIIGLVWPGYKVRVIMLAILAHYAWKLAFKAKYTYFLNEIFRDDGRDSQNHH